MFSLWNSVPSPGGVKTSTLPPIVVLLSIGYNLGAGVVVTSWNVPAANLTTPTCGALLTDGVVSGI